MVALTESKNMPRAFRSTETFDLQALRVIVHNWNVLPVAAWESHCSRPLVAVLKEYLRKAAADGDRGVVSVEYAYARGRGDGRQFAKGALSMQSMFREVRNTIARAYYHDVDMENAHPVILRQYCQRRGIPCRVLAEYIDNRDAKLAKIVERNGVDRAHAKKVVLAIMNGGTKDFEELADPPRWLAAFKAEMESVHAVMIADPCNAKILRSVIESKGDEYTNVGGSVCNRIMCAIENDMLMACVAYLTSVGAPTDGVVLVFDGIMIPRGTCSVDADFLERMQAHVHQVTGYAVRMVEKPMNDVLDLTGLKPGPVQLVCESEVEGAEIFLDIIRDRVVKCQGTVYVLTRDRVWSCSSTAVEDVLFLSAMYSNIFKDDGAGPKPFSSTLKGQTTLVKMVTRLIPDDPTFAERLFQGSLGKIFFRDGVYDFAAGRFREETEDDLTDRRIPRPFPVRDETKIAEVRERVLGTVFASAMDVKCYLQHVARAMAGCFEDKHWVVLLGFRCSGKGLLSGLNENAWGSYVRSVQSESFLMQRQSDGGDEAKKLSWLLACAGARMIMTQEIAVDAGNRDRKINGNLIKGKLASGGDTIMARRNYCDEVEFKIQGRLFMALNDMPPVTPADAYETMHMFNFPNQFVDGELPADALPHMKVGDPGIKAYCREQATVDAFVCMVLDAYTDFAVVKSEAVRIETDIFRQEGGDEWSALKELFDITGLPGDSVSSAAVAEAVQRAGLNLSKQLTRKRLEVLGCKYTNAVKIDGKLCRGFVGLKIVKVDDDV